MTTGLIQDRDALRNEVAALRGQLESKEEELRLIERLLEIRGGGESKPTAIKLPSHRQLNGRRSLTQSLYTQMEADSRVFSSVGDLLDYYGEPHYFSRVRPHQKDSAERQVLSWARHNPHLAAGVTVVLKDGTRVPLTQVVASL
jgi:hypothetical protein